MGNSVFSFDKQGNILLKGEVFFNGVDVSKDVLKLSGKFYWDTLRANSDADSYLNATRSFVIGCSALIPYGGVFISPLLGAIWPVSGEQSLDSILQKAMDRMAQVMDEKIGDYDIQTIKQQVKALLERLHVFEDSVNGKSQNGHYYSTGNIQESNRSAALQIQNRFHDLALACQKEGQKEAELPLFATIATAHLGFLKFMESNAKHPNLQMDAISLKTYFTSQMKSIAQVYKDYMFKTSGTGQNKIYTKMKNYGNRFSNYSTDPTEVIEEGQRILFHSYSPQSNKSLAEVMAPLKGYQDLCNQLKQYKKMTVDNVAFNIMVESILDKTPEINLPSDVTLYVEEKKKYVSANEKDIYITARADKADSWEHFKLISINPKENKFALQAQAGTNHNYVVFWKTLRHEAGFITVDGKDSLDIKTHFYLIALGNHKYAIEPVNTNGNYVRANFGKDGSLVADTKQIDKWETFTIEPYKNS
ncbi:insecticidal delta-endotoxin Cry8Ea1 family protein [Bacillus cereus]|uniref:insecticidal delta-endotoxin Cry8Ea1 family protein n=1 Tax=Bacillus cereus TaxID=1396 RepID=UPI0027D1FC50|nr:insecticidal delta-endotoxin Cry8Ea1 family protein [Bacillus cereus]